MTRDDRSPSLPSGGLLAAYLALAMAIGPLAHYTMSALGPLVVADLKLSATEFGWLWSVTFGAASIFTISGGKLTDRLGARRMLLAVFGVAAVGLVAVGTSRNYLWLLVGIAISGLVQAISNPATNLVIATEVPPNRRGLVVGVKQSGVQVGQFMVGVALPALALATSWRHAVMAPTVLALLGMFITWRVVPPSARLPKRRRAERAAVPNHIWWLSGYALLTGVAIQASNVYLPLYAHQELGATTARAGFVAAVLGGVGVLGRLAWGNVIDRILDVRMLLAWLAGLSAIAIGMFAVAGAWGEHWLWLGAGLFSFSALSANVVIMVAVVRGSPPEAVGHATGWPALGLYVGFMIGPPVFGVIVDSGGGYSIAWFALLAVSAVLALLTVHWATRGRPQRRDPGTVLG